MAFFITSYIHTFFSAYQCLVLGATDLGGKSKHFFPQGQSPSPQPLLRRSRQPSQAREDVYSLCRVLVLLLGLLTVGYTKPLVREAPRKPPNQMPEPSSGEIFRRGGAVIFTLSSNWMTHLPTTLQRKLIPAACIQDFVPSVMVLMMN